jgi:hypothetical protein
MHGLEEALKPLVEKKGFTGEDARHYMAFQDYLKFVGLPQIREMEKKYLPGDEVMARYEGQI